MKIKLQNFVLSQETPDLVLKLTRLLQMCGVKDVYVKAEVELSEKNRNALKAAGQNAKEQHTEEQKKTQENRDEFREDNRMAFTPVCSFFCYNNYTLLINLIQIDKNKEKIKKKFCSLQRF